MCRISYKIITICRELQFWKMNRGFDGFGFVGIYVYVRNFVQDYKTAKTYL